jgi:hypothetical protein
MLLSKRAAFTGLTVELIRCDRIEESLFTLC